MTKDEAVEMLERAECRQREQAYQAGERVVTSRAWDIQFWRDEGARATRHAEALRMAIKALKEAPDANL